VVLTDLSIYYVDDKVCKIIICHFFLHRCETSYLSLREEHNFQVYYLEMKGP
jgi:hypothetical protein